MLLLRYDECLNVRSLNAWYLSVSRDVIEGTSMSIDKTNDALAVADALLVQAEAWLEQLLHRPFPKDFNSLLFFLGVGDLQSQ